MKGLGYVVVRNHLADHLKAIGGGDHVVEAHELQSERDRELAKQAGAIVEENYAAAALRAFEANLPHLPGAFGAYGGKLSDGSILYLPAR